MGSDPEHWIRDPRAPKGTKRPLKTPSSQPRKKGLHGHEDAGHALELD